MMSTYKVEFDDQSTGTSVTRTFADVRGSSGLTPTVEWFPMKKSLLLGLRCDTECCLLPDSKLIHIEPKMVQCVGFVCKSCSYF